VADRRAGDAPARTQRRRCRGSPVDPERAEHRAPSLARRHDAIERPVRGARDAQPIERHLRRPSSAQRQPTAGGPPRQGQEATRPHGPEHQPPARSPRGRAQQRDGQCVIIAAQRAPGNGKTRRRDLKPKLRNEFQRAVPSPPIGGGVTAEAAQVAADAWAEAVDQQWQQRRAHPRAQVARVGVGGIVVRHEAARGDVRDELAMRERQQRPHQPVAPAAGDPGESRGCAAA